MSYSLLTEDHQLRLLAHKLRKESELAIDLEMEANYHHYGLHISLVQISNREENWIIDMLAIKDHRPLCELFDDPSVKKIFHDVSFDFRVLQELWNCVPVNIIDTKIAALLCGRSSISLGGLLEEEFGLKKNKQCQRADWLQRPLPQKMLDYAALDTSYLLKLKDTLIAELKDKGRFDWFTEEMAHVQNTDYSMPKPSCQDIKGSRSLTDRERGRLQALYDFRDKIAKEYDKPYFFIMPDKRMIELAKRPPKAQEWNSVHGVHPAIRKRGKLLHQLLHQARPLGKAKRPPKRRLSDHQLQEADRYIAKARKKAEELNIQAPMIMTRDQAIEIACTGSFETLKNWQKELLNVTEQPMG